jgi:ABC-type uncharacterized transport system fused permease/ATPase subunit
LVPSGGNICIKPSSGGQRNLERKLDESKYYYNEFRAHSSLAAIAPYGQSAQVEKTDHRFKVFRLEDLLQWIFSYTCCSLN